MVSKNLRCYIFKFVLILYFFIFNLYVQSQPQVDNQDKWDIETVVNQEKIENVSISPEGNKVVWEKCYPDFDKDCLLHDLYLTIVDIDGIENKTIQLTHTGKNYKPIWSPNGKWVGFLSQNEDKQDNLRRNTKQIYLLKSIGGIAFPITNLTNGVEQIAWLDKNNIIFTAREQKSQYEKNLEDKNDDIVAVEDTTLFYPIRLFSINIKTKQIKRLTHQMYKIEEFSPSPDGNYIVYSVNRSPMSRDPNKQPKQYLLNLKTNKVMEIFSKQYFDPSNFKWSKDSKGFYAYDEISDDPENEGHGIYLLYYYNISNLEYEQIFLNWEYGIGEGDYVVNKQGIIVQLANGPKMKPRYYFKRHNEWVYEDIKDYRLCHSTLLKISDNGENIVFDYSRANLPPQFFIGILQKGQIVHSDTLVVINKYLNNYNMPNVEIIHWEGADKDTVNGILYYPLNYKPNRSYPLIVMIHGGPHSCDTDTWMSGWNYYPQLWVQKGAFVLRPNYHGSSNHSYEFAQSIKKHYYEFEIPDIVKGVEYLIKKQLVHPDSLGVMGWSNGAILTIALTVEHPDLFKVAAPGAGDVNWISDYGTVEFGVKYDNSYFGGPPWERTEHYVKKSPIFKMENVVTPTIIHFGTEDRAVPPEQGWQHYRALQQIGKAPVRFLLIPGEGHSLKRPSHQRRKMKEEIIWFDNFLFGKESIKKNIQLRIIPQTSPLALLNRMQNIKSINGLYGEMNHEILVPEIIKIKESLYIGRFEVTRAQFKEFSSSYHFSSGTENYPANNISFVDAKAYVDWLSKKTGNTYRLPTEEELIALRKFVGIAENNLSYWLSYSPNYDEKKWVNKYLKKIMPDHVLMEVGDQPPGNINDPNGSLIFDVDGNVSEWAITKDGNGKPVNNSALSMRDERTGELDFTPQKYIGLRIVFEK